MKFTDQIVVHRKIEAVFAWLAQPAHLVQLITIGPAGQKLSIHSQPPASGEGSSSPTPPESKVEIHNLAATSLSGGATFQFVIRLKFQSQEWRMWHSGSVEITEYRPPYALALKSRREKYPPLDYRMTLQPQQEGTSIIVVVMTHPGWRGLLYYLVPALTSLSKVVMAGQIQMLKEQLEREAEYSGG
ncbi:MAG: hypothetical protein ACJ788_20435 [Ktedonobacteraceae bacterium]